MGESIMNREYAKHRYLENIYSKKPAAFLIGFAILTMLTTSSCVNRPVEIPSKFDVLEPGGYFPQTKEKKVDMLFVIDDSISMLDDQLELKQRISELIEALRVDDDQIPAIDPATCTATNRDGCNIPSIRVGVTTTNLGAGGFIINQPEVDATTGDVIVDADGNPIIRRIAPCDEPGTLPAYVNSNNGLGGNLGKLRNFKTTSSFSSLFQFQATDNESCNLGASKNFIDYDSEATPPSANVPAVASNSGDPVKDVISAIQCLATVGGQGCFFEQPLEAAKRALDPALGINPDFLREDALLSIIIITDEDDCSTPRPDLDGTTTDGPELYATELVTLRKFPERGPVTLADEVTLDGDGKVDITEPSRTGKYDPVTGSLGLYDSFRCFEQGVRCKKADGEFWEGPIDARNHIGPIDEKTCSAAPEEYGLLSSVTSYIDFFKGLKPDPSRVLVTVFAGPTSVEDGYVGISGNTAITDAADLAFSDILDIGELGNENSGTPFPFERGIVSVLAPDSPYRSRPEFLAITSYPALVVDDNYSRKSVLLPSCMRLNPSYDSNLPPNDNPNALNLRFLQSGEPGIRLKTLTNAFGNNGQFASICSPSFGPALKELGELINSKLGAQCIDSPILTETGNLACVAGVANNNDDPASTCTKSCLEKADCVVQDVTNAAQGTGTLIPKCDDATFLDSTIVDCAGATNCPCWRLRAKPECDPAKIGSPFGLDILRDPASQIQQGLITTSRCSGTTATWGSADLLALQECD